MSSHCTCMGRLQLQGSPSHHNLRGSIIRAHAQRQLPPDYKGGQGVPRPSTTISTPLSTLASHFSLDALLL